MSKERESENEPTYRLGRQWILRMTGFPVEQLLALRAPKLTAACDRVLEAERNLATAASALRTVASEAGSSADRIRRRVSAGRAIDVATEGLPPSVSRAIDAYRDALDAVERANAALESMFGGELETVRRALYTMAREERFRHALLLSSPGLDAVSNPPDPSGPLPVRTSEWRRREATWVSYLQRFTMKNETISFFGPSAWGTTERASEVGVQIDLDDAGVDRRVVYFERGTCDALVAKIAEEASDFSPDPLPITTDPFGELHKRVERIADGEVRARWLARLSELDADRAGFEKHPDLEARPRLLGHFDELFEAWGVQRAPGRGLYAARLPVNEDCRRALHTAVLGRGFIEPVENDLAPWYELWRDLAGLYMSRLSDRLRAIHATLGDRPRLDEFLRAAAKAGLPIERTGGLGHFADLDQEIQTAWQEQLGDRVGRSEVELTADDLAFVRRRYQFRRMRDADVPAPDLHFAAPDARAAREGHGTVVLGEIHPDFTLWEHCFFAFCPDAKQRVEEHRALHGPALVWGRHLVEMGAHTSLPRALMGNWSACAPYGPEGVPTWRPDQLWVECTASDLSVRNEAGELLGSLLDNWSVALNTHRLEFLGTGRHSPRLRVGRVIVQRESWLVEPGEAIRKAVEQSGPELLLGVRRFQREYGLPNLVFVRPILSSRSTLHNDSKPIFVDFDNPLLVEMLGALIRKFLQFRVSEVQPRVEDWWLSDSRGHYCAEFRMVARPAERLSGAHRGEPQT